MTTSRAAKSTCPGKCAECKRSAMNGGTCPTWEQVYRMTERGPMSPIRVAVAMGVTVREVDDIIATACERVKRHAAWALAIRGERVDPGDLFSHARSVWDGDEEAA